MTAGIILTGCVLGSLLSVASVRAQSDGDFKGKTIRLIIGTSTGGGVDLYARLVAQFLGKHLPGEPVLIAQNMPGASSVVAANYLFSAAKPDGLTLGALQGGAFFDQVLGHNTVKFDWAKFTWIGSPERLEAQLYMRADSPFKTLEDIRRAASRPVAAARGPELPATSCRKSWKKLSASNSKP